MTNYSRRYEIVEQKLNSWLVDSLRIRLAERRLPLIIYYYNIDLSTTVPRTKTKSHIENHRLVKISIWSSKKKAPAKKCVW